MKLHLGCGGTYLPGYINIDYPVTGETIMNVKADVYQDITTLVYPDSSIEEIRNHHVFEHFDRVKALELLLQWRRWLQTDGKLVIETPDYFWCNIIFPLAPFKFQMEIGRHIFGSQEAPWAKHLDFWYAGKFRKVLSIFGFKKIKISHPVYRNLLPNVKVECYKGSEIIDENAVLKEVLGWYILTGENKEKFLNNWLKK